MSVGRYIVQDSLGRDVFITPEVDQTLHERYANESYLRGLVRRERYEQDRKFVSSRHYGISTEGFKISGVGFIPQIPVPEVRSIDDMKIRQEQIERMVADVVPFPNLEDPKAVRNYMDQVARGKDKNEKNIDIVICDEEKERSDLRYVEMENLADKISQVDLEDNLTDEDEMDMDVEIMYDSTITEEKDIKIGLNRYGEYDAELEQKDRDILRAMKQNGSPLTAFYEYQIAFDKWFEDDWPIPYWLRNASDIRKRGLWRKDVDTIIAYKEADYYVDYMSNEYFIDISKYIHLVLLQDKKRFIYVASNDYALVIGRKNVTILPHRVKDPIIAVVVEKGVKGWVREEEGKMFKFCVRCKGIKMTTGCEIQRYTDVSLGTTNFTYFLDGKHHPGFIIAKMVDGSVTNYEFNGTGHRIPFFKRNTHIVSLCGYHNLIKGLMLEACTVMGTRHLDMCCGRGGDFHRILARRFSVNVFVDRDFHRIEEFYTRYHDSSIDASLVITNDFSECVYEGLEGLFESISCFFGIQYMFESQSLFTNFIRNMYRLLVKGGSFFGLFPMYESMTRFFEGPHYFNNYFKIHAYNNKSYGNEVEFQVLDTNTTTSPYREYAVSYREFFHVASGAGFRVQKELPDKLKRFFSPYESWYILRGQGPPELRDLSMCYSFFWLEK